MSNSTNSAFGKRIQDGMRSFKLVSAKYKSYGKNYKMKIGKSGGRYVSKTPQAAALKMHNRKCRDKKSNYCVMTITLRETTRGSAKKDFSYKVLKRKLSTPKTLKGRVVKFKTTIKALN